MQNTEKNINTQDDKSILTLKSDREVSAETRKLYEQHRKFKSQQKVKNN